ncbi:MAG: hypothetical protein WDO13_01185 [Verrucomicrobiota bacterium]
MLILRTLSRWFPGLRPLFAGIGYLLLLIGGVVWFVCFPLTAYTLYTAHEFPLDYFGISVWLGFPARFLPAEGALAGAGAGLPGLHPVRAGDDLPQRAQPAPAAACGVVIR